MLLLLEQVVRSSPVLEVSGLAHDTAEARMILLRKRPDLVLLDEVLPGESALDFAEELARDGIPFVLITGMENPDHPVPPQALGRLKKPEWRRLAKEQGPFTQAIVDFINQGKSC